MWRGQSSVHMQNHCWLTPKVKGCNCTLLKTKDIQTYKHACMVSNKVYSPTYLWWWWWWFQKGSPDVPSLFFPSKGSLPHNSGAVSRERERESEDGCRGQYGDDNDIMQCFFSSTAKWMNEWVSAFIHTHVQRGAMKVVIRLSMEVFLLNLCKHPATQLGVSTRYLWRRKKASSVQLCGQEQQSRLRLSLSLDSSKYVCVWEREMRWEKLDVRTSQWEGFMSRWMTFIWWAHAKLWDNNKDDEQSRDEWMHKGWMNELTLWQRLWRTSGFASRWAFSSCESHDGCWCPWLKDLEPDQSRTPR